MNSESVNAADWNWRHWVSAGALIFFAQIFLIYFLSASSPFLSGRTNGQATVRLVPRPLTESQFTAAFLASDPTLFALPNRHGFSGEAWLNVEPRNYDILEKSETAFWLPLNLERLGQDAAEFAGTNSQSSLHMFDDAPPEILRLPIWDFPSIAKTNSLLRVEGDLAFRKLLAMPALKNWAHSEILSNSVAQIAVDKSGTVVSARLLGRSGLSDADRSALEISRELRFVPARKELDWGKIIFEWRTDPIIATNGVNKFTSP